MRNYVIRTETAEKSQLVGKIKMVLANDYYCGDVSVEFDKVNQFLEALREKLVFLIEYPYVDKHYRDSYYCYHSAKRETMGRDAIRIHVFEEGVDAAALGKVKSQKELDCIERENGSDFAYLGFFVVRPLPRHPLGRSLISPLAFRRHDFVCCLTKGRACVNGLRLSVTGFPHVAQDGETHSCAESSLWSLLEYYGTHYAEYRPLLPSQILQSLSDTADHRLLPSRGLSLSELSRALNANGHPSMMRLREEGKDAVKDNDFFWTLGVYVESGIPVIACLHNKKDAHAALVVGHVNFVLDADKPVADGWPWKDVSEFRKFYVFIDDNMPPYQIARLDMPAVHYDEKFPDAEIAAFIVPLHRHMHLDAGRARKLTEQVFDDPGKGLHNYGKGWITRLFLTGGRSFKEAVLRDSLLDGSIREFLLHIVLPKFVWVCEIFKLNDYSKKICCGILLLDATGDSSISSVILYFVDNKVIQSDGSEAWEQDMEFRSEFRMNAYMNNLKGEWNGWQV